MSTAQGDSYQGDFTQPAANPPQARSGPSAPVDTSQQLGLCFASLGNNMQDLMDALGRVAVDAKALAQTAEDARKQLARTAQDARLTVVARARQAGTL